MNDSGNPYLNPDGSPSPRESVVVFLDLLGYGALLENSYATNSQMPALQRLHTAMRDAYAPIRGFPLHGDQRSWEARTFTDNTIIGFPLFLDRDAEAELALITGRVARFQFELAKHGFLVRGAIASYWRVFNGREYCIRKRTPRGVSIRAKQRPGSTDYHGTLGC